jgi:hypothetical protein
VKYFIRLNYFIVFVVTALILLSCDGYKKNSTHQQVSDESIKAGKQLAVMYCQACHLLPDPSLLDARSWERGVLPSMGPMLGIFNKGFEEYPSYRRDPELDSGFYPSTQQISTDHWLQILDYYTALAPDSITTRVYDQAIDQGMKLFSPVKPSFSIPFSMVSFIKIDTSLNNQTLMVYEVNRKSMYRFSPNLKPLDSIVMGTSIVDVNGKNKTAITANMGIMIPNNGKHGTANRLWLDSSGKMVYDSIPVFDSLRRPVQITGYDLNNDGKEDYLLCEYGNLRGGFSWMENAGNGKFIKHIIREVPGAIKAWVKDYNNDGLSDIYVQFAQGDESIFLYTNKGKGEFEEKRLLRFPPSYGSTYFELADFNNDGFQDIVYTSGDNADFSPILKPYHGVYVFWNDGKNNFTQKYFFHINGCFKAMARDFDNDGDLDIATISFFADYKNRPEEGFVYLENEGINKFKPFSIPETNKGKWLTMDAGDLDGDGRIDIVLGNFTPPMRKKRTSEKEESSSFLFLKNMGK